MGRLEEILERCREIAEDVTFAEVRRWKEAHPQGKIVGHFQVYFPEEIAHAGGMLPVKVAGAGNKIEARRADSRLPSFICSICRTSLELGLNGTLDFLDAIFFHPICDAARNLAGIWHRNFPRTIAQILYLPQNLATGGAVSYLYNEYQRLRREFSELIGRPITDEDLRRSIEIYNENRRLLHQLYAIKRESPWLITAADVYALMRAGTVMPREEHNQLLRQVLEELPQRQVRPRDKIRAMLDGAFCEQPPLEFIEVLEEVCYLVDDDLLLGVHFIQEDVPLEGDPLWNLAASYVHRTCYSPVQHDGRRTKEEMFLEKVRRCRAQAVILSPAKFCEPGLDEQVAFAKALDHEGLPYLMLEFEEKMTSFDQVRVQVETFAESILFYS